jgi:hypothetical protein
MYYINRNIQIKHDDKKKYYATFNDDENKIQPTIVHILYKIM